MTSIVLILFAAILISIIIYLIIAGFNKLFPFDNTSKDKQDSESDSSLGPYDREGTVVIPFYPHYYRPHWWHIRRHRRGPFGSDRDRHGCIRSAGYSWDGSKCSRPW